MYAPRPRRAHRPRLDQAGLPSEVTPPSTAALPRPGRGWTGARLSPAQSTVTVSNTEATGWPAKPETQKIGSLSLRSNHPEAHSEPSTSSA